jgi:ribosome assembly protein RRB1
MPPKRKVEGISDGAKNRADLTAETEEVDGYYDEGTGLVFEDPFGDEFEEEDIIENVDDENEEGDSEMVLDEDGNVVPGESKAPETNKQVWRPGVDNLEEGETLEYDPSTYVMYHSLKFEWPCLSFDILKDTLGDGRQRVCALVDIYYS